MRLSGTKTGAVNQYRGLGNQLWDLAGNRPSLDLPFSDTKSLVDATTGTTLVDHTRASSGTYVGSDGLIKTATTNYLLQSEDFSTTWSADGVCTVSTDQILSPVGTLTADKITVDAGGPNRVSQTPAFQVVAGGTYMLSAYVKTLDINQINIRLFLSGSDAYADYVFASNSLSVSNASILTQAGYTPLGDNWNRIFVKYQPTVSGNVNIRFGGGVVGTPTSGSFYLWGAQLEQSSTVGEYIPTTSTINSAPRFDHDPTTGESLGLLVEESRTNLKLYSGAWDANGWVTQVPNPAPSNVTVLAPDGTNTAWEYPTNATGYLQQNVTVAAGQSSTLSFFAKQGTSTEIHGFSGISTDDRDASGPIYDWGTDTLSTGWSKQSYGDDWYRFSKTYTSVTSTLLVVRLNNQSGGGYFWGFQVENGSFPTSYIPTEGTTVTRAADVASISGNNFGTTNLLSYSEEFEQASWSKTNVSVSQNSIAAPNGKVTADLVAENTSNALHRVSLGGPVVAGLTYTTSVYAKSTERFLFMNCGAMHAANATFDLQAGTVANTGSGSAAISPAGNGWYRCSVTGVAATTGTVSFYFQLNDTNVASDRSYTGDGTSGIYLWGAQLEQSSTATPYIKSDVTWNSRASNATYYDSTGALKKSSYNELPWSEEFDQWIDNGVTLTADAIEAPDGTLTAEKVEGVNTTTSYLYRPFTSALANTTYTFSFWIKSVDGSSGTWGVNYYNGSSHNNTTVPVTGEWNRVSVQFSNFSAVNNNVYIADNRGGLADLAEVYIWGAQLEKGTYAGDYVKTEASAASAARTNAYLPDGSGNFVSAGELLLEGAGTNLLTYSEDFSSANPTQLTFRGNVIANQTTSPDGAATADSFLETSETGNHIVQIGGFSFASGTTYTYSVFLKPNGRNAGIRVRAANTTTFAVEAFFDLTGPGSVASTVQGTATIKAFANGWYRCSLTGVSGASAATGLQHYSSSAEGDITKGVYIWGAQLEASPYATSYIPTAGSQVTRAADVSTSSSNTFGNSWYRQDEGTVFVDSERQYAVPSGEFSQVFFINDGTGNNTINLGYLTVGASQFRIRTASNNQVNFLPSVATLRRVTAGAYAANDAAASEAGSPVSVGSPSVLPSALSQLNIGSDQGGGTPLNGTIRRLTYWPTRLPNETLQGITQ